MGSSSNPAKKIGISSPIEIVTYSWYKSSSIKHFIAWKQWRIWRKWWRRWWWWGWGSRCMLYRGWACSWSCMIISLKNCILIYLFNIYLSTKILPSTKLEEVVVNQEGSLSSAVRGDFNKKNRSKMNDMVQNSRGVSKVL